MNERVKSRGVALLLKYLSSIHKALVPSSGPHKLVTGIHTWNLRT